MHPFIYNLSVNMPNTINISSLFGGIILNKPIGLVFLVVVIIGNLINRIMKSIIRQPRPKGAKNCKLYVTCTDIIAKSYGMPSGHSQSMGVILGFWLCYIWYDKLIKDDKKDKQSNVSKYIGTLLLTATCLWVPYTRIVIGCHSVIQVIIGFITGLCIGISSYVIYDNHIKSTIDSSE